MNDLPHNYPTVRATRVHPPATPVVLRTHEGLRSQGRLELVSLTGGLLSLARVLNSGAKVKLMFVTDAGPLLASVEMLPPVSWGEQPFRFLNTCEADRRRLQTAIKGWLALGPTDEWIEKYRAAISTQKPARSKFISGILAALALSAVCVCGLVYRLM